MNTTSVSPNVHGSSIIVFIAMLAGFVVESELTQFVQSDLQYRHPFFLFWIVHSSFSLILPIHLLYLQFYKRNSVNDLFHGFSLAIASHLGPPGITSFPWRQFIKLILFMTIGLTIPGLLWFAAVSLAYVGDVTAIWNTNAFFAYLITVKLFAMPLEPKKLLAVIMATVGVIIVVYGGSSQTTDVDSNSTAQHKPSAPLVGDLLTLVASLGYGAYQAFYKKYAALPDAPELQSELTAHYEPISGGDEEEGPSKTTQPTLPFGLHSNFLTSSVGLATLLLCWLAIPILHWTAVEPFALPHSGKIVISIMGICLSGMVFNSALMILLAEWGAIITSVGNLLTIILVMVADIIFGAGLEAMTLWSVLGSSIISISFGVLAWDMSRKES